LLNLRFLITPILTITHLDIYATCFARSLLDASVIELQEWIIGYVPIVLIYVAILCVEFRV